MNTGILGDSQALNTRRTTVAPGLPGQAAFAGAGVLTVRRGWLFVGGREYSAECLEAGGPLGPQDAECDDPEA